MQAEKRYTCEPTCIEWNLFYLLFYFQFMKLRIFAKFSLHGKLIHYINNYINECCPYLIKNAQTGLQW